jgi:putative nucleotidyltransferase with HDIG domain
MQRPRVDLYRLGVVGAALAALLLESGHLWQESPSWLLAAGFVVAGATALQFPLSLSLTNRVTVASAVFFAGLLTLSPLVAAVAAGGASALDAILSVSRLLRSRRSRPQPSVVLLALSFNAALAFLCVLIPASVLPAARIANVAHAGWGRTLLAAAGAAIMMHLLNLFLMNTAHALKTGTRIVHVVASAQRSVRFEFAGLYITGLAAAIALDVQPWAVVGLVPVMVALRWLLERAVRLRRETIAAVERMAELVDRRDPYTADHSRRVATYSVAIGRELGMDSNEIELLRLAAMVHDIGKIEIPDSVLLKDGRLTPAEKAIMNEHPRRGYELLREFSDYARVRELVLTHHERFDGRGYPSGIRASSLPMIAQVIPVADSLDAMTSARPYRAALPWRVALDELARGRRSQWNPDAIDAAVNVFAARAEELCLGLAIA